MTEFQFQFEKLSAWQEARKLVKSVYGLLEKFPKHEQYALCDQLRRAVISVPSNLAEGNSRVAIKEQIHFCEIAFGSLMEVYCQLQIALDLGLVVVTCADHDVENLRWTNRANERRGQTYLHYAECSRFREQPKHQALQFGF